MALSLATALIDIDRALWNTIRRNLQTCQTAATIAALRALTTQGASGSDKTAGQLVYVTAAGVRYEWSKTSTAADDGAGIIKPTDVTGSNPGRWLATTATATSGNVVRVVFWNGETHAKEWKERIVAERPAIGIVWESSSNNPRSTIPGAIFDYETRWSIWCIDENFRLDYEALLGSDWSFDSAHPGAMRLLGDVKKLLADENKKDARIGLGTGDVKIIQVGDEDVEDADSAERVMILRLGITVIASVENPDAASEHVTVSDVRVQPDFGHDNQQTAFDRDNYVISGFRVFPQMGFTATPAAGSIVIGGVTVAVTPALHTFGSHAETYMDIAATGAITYVAVEAGSDEPAQTASTIRVARIVTDGSGIVSWEPHTAQAAPFGDAYGVVP